jgi:glutathione-regulated potassium-efflux system ancillary protein KefG
MAKVLIIFAHPALEKSRIHSKLIQGIEEIPQVTFRDLYEKYPDFDIDIDYEKELLLEHDVIVFQHPFYWYSAPALIKQWIDLVLEHGWAYGRNGNALKGKVMLNAITTGGNKESYTRGGYNRFTVRELLLPFDQTAHLCHMHYWPPFVIHGTHRINNGQIDFDCNCYHEILQLLVNDKIIPGHIEPGGYLNQLLIRH